MNYPVLEVLSQLKQALGSNGKVILQAPPGAGKSTVLPLHLLDEPWLAGKKIIMLQPRRLAARMVAARLADQLSEDVGATAGYRIRFESKTTAATRIEVVTEGILTRMMQTDNSLPGVGLVVFDEFHERSLHADLALALCLQSQKVLREDLRILIMSATLETESLSGVLGNAPVITSMGRSYPVEFHYGEPDKDAPLSKRVARAVVASLRDTSGDVLVFLPGTGDIMRTAQLLEASSISASVHTLYGDLTFKKQQEALLPDVHGGRKVVLSTAIAETSLTIEGISVVIDSGFSRVSRFDPRSGLSRLETVKVTRDSADQRAGRAGRLGPGVCYRLWPELTHQHLLPSRSPEILEADLSTLVLELFQWGVRSPEELTWVTPPPQGAVLQARELLEKLGAIADNQITGRGREMLKLPAHPRFAHMLLEASTDKRQLALATDLVAILDDRDPLTNAGADITLRIEALRRLRQGSGVGADRSALERINKTAAFWRRHFHLEEDNGPVQPDRVGRLVMSAYPERIARQEAKHSERYKLANSRVAMLPQHDNLVTEGWLAIANLDAGPGKIHLAAPLAESDVDAIATTHQVVVWDSERKLVSATRERRVGNVVVSAQPVRDVTDDARVEAILAAVRTHGLALLGWDEARESWQARVGSLKKWRGEPWPDVSNSALLGHVSEWLPPYLDKVWKQSDLERLDWNAILTGLLPWELQRDLDKLAPVRIEVPSGSFIALKYFPDGQSPVMEVRLQEVFGLRETPAVNEGRTKVVMHLLSPGYKPVQVTQDLHSFWDTTYHEVRKELRRRYPKHSWPDDPWTATAVRGARRRN